MMARRPRLDEEGTFHHLVNRGIARRPLFEHSTDIRYFLAQVGRAVRRGEIEVHAYCVLTTHYHMLVRCLGDSLEPAMRQIQTRYSRWFNRSRRRDGSMVRARFQSKLVDSMAYREAVVRYIDANAPKAGLVGRARDYPYCSAWHYARSDGPPWLERSWVEGWSRDVSGRPTFDEHAYGECFPAGDDELNELVEIRMRSRGIEDALDDLLGAAPPKVLEWFERKSRLADGTRPGLPVVAPSRLIRTLERDSEGDDWIVVPNHRRRDAWRILRVGLERDLCGSTLRRIGLALGISNVRVLSLYRAHRDLILEDPSYAERSSRIAASLLSVNNGVRRRT